MLGTLCFWPLLGLPLIYAATIRVIPSSDRSIVYSSGWTPQFSESTQEPYIQADGFVSSITVTLPTNASSVSYVGFKRSGGSMYGYTVDCQTECLLDTVNATDPTVTDDASAPQSTLFTIALDPSTQHTLYVYNIPSDLENAPSEINLDNLSVTLDDVMVPTATAVIKSGSPPPATSSASPASVSVQASTSPTPLSSVGATSSSSNSVSATSISGVSSSSATTGSAPVASASSPPSAPVPSITPSGNGTAEAGNGASSSSTNGGSPKTLAIGLTVLAIVFTGCVITALVVCIRQRRKRKNYGGSSDSSSRPPLSPAGSIMPIMRPPQMRQSDFNIPNPFIDPPSEPPSEISSLDIQFNSSLMQRRMEGRSSPGSPASAAPTIPLPDIPRSGIDGRSNSPATSYARNDLWITRSPAKPSFSVV